MKTLKWAACGLAAGMTPRVRVTEIPFLNPGVVVVRCRTEHTVRWTGDTIDDSTSDAHTSLGPRRAFLSVVLAFVIVSRDKGLFLSVS